MMRLTRARFVLVSAVALAGTTSGCGGSDEDKVRDAVSSYFAAVAEGDGEAACDQLSGNGQRELVGAVNDQLPEVATIECAGVVEQLSGLLGPDEESLLSDAEVSEVEIDGDTATATVEGATVTPELVKSGDDWLIESGFAGP